MSDHAWEPSLTDLYEDPVLHLLLARDGLRLADVMAVVEDAAKAIAPSDIARLVAAE